MDLSMFTNHETWLYLSPIIIFILYLALSFWRK